MVISLRAISGCPRRRLHQLIRYDAYDAIGAKVAGFGESLLVIGRAGLRLGFCSLLGVVRGLVSSLEETGWLGFLGGERSETRCNTMSLYS